MKQRRSVCVCVCEASPSLCSSSVCAGVQERDSHPTEAGREGERGEEEEERGDDHPSDRALSSSSSRRGPKGSAIRDEGPRNRAPTFSRLRDMTDGRSWSGAGLGFWSDGEQGGGAVYSSRAVGGCHKGPERNQARQRYRDRARDETLRVIISDVFKFLEY